MEIQQFQLHHRTFRVKINIPEYANACCLIVPSGQMGRWDQEGAEGEKSLYSHLFSLLPAHGIGVVQPDMPLREQLDLPADEQHLREREEVLQQTLQLPLFSRFPPEKIIFLGVSLGGTIVLNHVSQPYENAILIGCVIEEKISWKKPPQTIHLIYGSHDYIAYVDETEQLIPIAPEEYSKECVKVLQESGVSQVSSTILQGYSHTLAPRENPIQKPEQFILKLIQSMV